MPQPYRPLATLGALLGWFGLALQFWMSIRLTSGFLAGLWLFLGFYTILSNLLVAASLTAVAMGPRGTVSRFFVRPGVQTALAMSITIVGLIYNVMLRGLWHPEGWQLLADVIVHDVMPVLYLIYWWLAVSKRELRWHQVLVWQSYPAAYFLYVLLRGLADGWYPYPFLDVKTLGYAQVVIDACFVLLAFIAVGLVLVGLGRWQARRRGDVVANAV
ncbi:MAG TPA: Pr6Pr family membrane protein [Dyella sp.]